MPALTAKQTAVQLKGVPDWTHKAKTIRRTFKFDGLLSGIAFVRQVAMLAEKMNHHPDIDIRYTKITLALTTHDQGGLSKKDFALAKKCDALFAKTSAS